MALQWLRRLREHEAQPLTLRDRVTSRGDLRRDEASDLKPEDGTDRRLSPPHAFDIVGQDRPLLYQDLANDFRLQPTPTAALMARALQEARMPDDVLIRDTLPAPVADFDSFNVVRRWEDGKACSTCLTTIVWTTHYVDEQGQSTSCTTTSFATATVTNPPVIPGSTYWTNFQTTTITLSESSTTIQAAPHHPIAPQPQLVNGLDCDCEQQWLKYLLGGIPYGVPEVIACLTFFFAFAAYFVVTLLRLQRYAYDREMFFFLLPLLLFMGCIVAALPTRAFAATNNSTGHILAQDVMLAIAVPILVEVTLQLYGLLRKRAIPSGWIDATAIFLRIINAVALILFAVAASELVTFVTGWEHGTETCASTLLDRIGILNIVADFLEIILLVLGMLLLFWVRWRLRIGAGPLVIQYLLYGLLLIHFLWRVMHDIDAANAWRHRNDVMCGPIPGAVTATSSNAATTYFFDFDWPSHASWANNGTNSPAAWWLIGFLPVFLAATLLMIVNLFVYATWVADPMAEPDSARYRLCYNEDSKKMEFQRIDNPGAPVLPNGEPLYEIIRDNSGEGWEIREARVSTVLGTWTNVTLRPWYK